MTKPLNMVWIVFLEQQVMGVYQTEAAAQELVERKHKLLEEHPEIEKLLGIKPGSYRIRSYVVWNRGIL